jgi:hypothetical protein
MMKKLSAILLLLGSASLAHALAYLPTPTAKSLRAGMLSGELTDGELTQLKPSLENYVKAVYATRKADLNTVQTQLKILLENEDKQVARNGVPEEFERFLRREPSGKHNPYPYLSKKQQKQLTEDEEKIRQKRREMVASGLFSPGDQAELRQDELDLKEEYTRKSAKNHVKLKEDLADLQRARLAAGRDNFITPDERADLQKMEQDILDDYGTLNAYE